MEGFLVAVLIGAIAGWLAGKIMKGSGYGLIGDIIVGVIGGFIGSFLWRELHLPTMGGFWISSIITATVGAIVLLLVLRLIRR